MDRRYVVPVIDLAPGIDLHREEYLEAARRVLESGRYVLGLEVEEFEHEVADYLGASHVVGVNSGTDALVIGLRALGVSPGDEVITSTFTFFATVEAIIAVGASPVLVDIDPRTFNIDAKAFASAITPRTRAVIPVHLYGQACDLDAILGVAHASDLLVLEDVAQAFGGRWDNRSLATIGHAGALSFFPTKNLGGFGDGGAIVTNDDGVASQARMLRAHGAHKKYENESVGYNSRLDAIQAALLRVRLSHLAEANAGRARVALKYTEALRDCPGLMTPHVQPGIEHVYHQYTIRVLGGKRDLWRVELGRRGVETMVYYPTPVHKLPVMDSARTALREAELASVEVLSLPIWPEMQDEQDRVIECILSIAS